MKQYYSHKFLIIIVLVFSCVTKAEKNIIDLYAFSTKGLDKDVEKVINQTRQLILTARERNDDLSQSNATKKWCILIHNFNFLDAAKKCYYSIGLVDKNNAKWAYLYAKVAIEQGDEDEIHKGLLETIKRDNMYLPAYYYLIKSSIESGDLEQAFKFKDNIPVQLQLTSNMLNLYGDLYAEVENNYVAIGFYKQAIKLVPQAKSLNYKIAQAYSFLGENKLAESYLQDVNEVGIALKDPYYQEVKNMIVGEIPYLIKAKSALKHGDYQQAIESYTKALRYNPHSQSAQINISVAYYQNKQTGKALQSFEKVLKNHPNNLKALFNLAIIQQSQNNPKLAINYFKKYREIEANDITVNHNLIELYYQQGEYQKVVKLVDEIADKNDESLQFSKAKALIYLKDYSIALLLLEQIYLKNSNNRQVLLTMAKLYSQVPDISLRNAEKSLKYAQLAHELEITTQSYWQIFVALDELKKCENLLNKMIELDNKVKKSLKEITQKFKFQRGNELKCAID